MNKFYRIENYDELGRFCSNFNEQNYKWASGHSLYDADIYSLFSNYSYPIIMEVDYALKKIYHMTEDMKRPKNFRILECLENLAYA